MTIHPVQTSSFDKKQIDALIAEGCHSDALAAMRSFFFAAPTLSNASFVVARMPKVQHLQPSRVQMRLAILRSFTVEPAAALLRAYAALYGVDLEIRFGEFNTYAQELLSPTSFLAEFQPNIVVVAAQTRDLLPDAWDKSSLDLSIDLPAACERALADMQGYLQAYRSRSSASIVVQMLELPEWPVDGVLGSQASQSDVAMHISRFNNGLRETAAALDGVYLLDYDALVARHGRERWHDEQKWLTMRMPVSADCLPSLAQEYLRFVLPLAGKSCKALVCDLDNTLWGGVIGEDGIAGIKLDAEYPGAAYRALQQVIANLAKRGIILAVASKNNEADALLAIEQHSGMLLRAKDFSVMRINWNDKAQSLREIARELNIGIDSLAFIDDNPVERRRVQAELPEVCVIDLPADPMRYASALQACPVFERLTISSEDRERGRMYAEQRERAALEGSSGTLEEFYRSLKQTLEIAPVDDLSLARVAQLTQKTNQFNTTTLRCSEQEIASMAAKPDCDALCMRVTDRFGDNGIVAVALLRYSGDRCEIVDLLMSCRVIGRKVETAILAQIMRRARNEKGSNVLWGWFIPTAKNAPAAEFYPQHGFAAALTEGDGRTAWEYDLTQALLPSPDFIELVDAGASIDAPVDKIAA